MTSAPTTPTGSALPADKLNKPDLRARIGIALFGALLAGALAAHTQMHGGQGSDYRVLWNAAHDVAHGIDPYGVGFDGSLPSLVARFFYPLPAALMGAPFASLPVPLAAVCFEVCAGFLLMFAITHDGFERVPLVLSIPFIVAAKIAQTTPLITALALLPALAGCVFLKPNLAIAFFLRSPRMSAALVALCLFGVATLAFPGWPGHWIATMRSSTVHDAPIRTSLGFVGLAAISRWRRPEARLLLAMTVVPHGLGFYDEIPLWLVALTRHEAMLLTLASWLACLAWLGIGDGKFMHSGTWSTAFLYVPATAMVLRRPNEGHIPPWLERRLQVLPRWLRGISVKQPGA